MLQLARHPPECDHVPVLVRLSMSGRYLSCMHAPTEPDGADQASVAARPVEYEAATQRWMLQTVEHIMRARDRIYAQLRTETVETVPATRLDLGEGQEFAVDPLRIHAAGSIAIDPLIAGDLEGLYVEVSGIADQQLEQTMRAYFAMINKVTDKVGNTVDARGDAAEGLLAALEKMDIAFGEDGRPALQMIVSPADEDRIRAQLNVLTPEQQQRLTDTINRKREAYFASQRRRRLPRYGH